MIKSLNSKSKDELQHIGIQDKTETILEIKRVMNRKNLMVQLENNCLNLEASIPRFQKEMRLLNKKGLAGLIGVANQLSSLTEYQDKLSTISHDKSKFANVKGQIIGERFIDLLVDDLSIFYEIRHLFMVKPIYQNYTELDEAYRKLRDYSMPDESR